jgi:hypothetical protein
MLRTASPILLAAISIAVTPAVSQPPSGQSHTNGRTPVLVELFTSEGCSNCPPADALLARLGREQPVPNADLLILEEHVDYWESLGWHDRFAARQFTDRQAVYARQLRLDSPYTPQLIVDGTYQLVGNDATHALGAIAQAARAPKLVMSISPVTFDGTHLTGEVSLLPSSVPLPKADLYAAVVESMASTQVLSGENGGRTLQHVSVVRAMQRIGSPAEAISGPLKFSLSAPKGEPTSNLRVVVFLQRVGQGAVLGAISSQAATPGAASSIAAIQPAPAR